MAGFIDLVKKLKGSSGIDELANAVGVPSSLTNLFNTGPDVNTFMPANPARDGTHETDTAYKDGSSLYYPHDLFENQTSAYIYFMVRDSQASNSTMYDSGTTYTSSNTGAASLFKRLALYMPPSIKVNYGTKWEEVSLTLERDVGILANLGPNAGTGLAAAAMAASVADKKYGTQSVQNQLEVGSKSILDPQAALLFKGVEFREFQFDFQLLARTRQESEDIRKIIKTFKWAMHPAKGGGVTWQYPCFFEIHLLTPTQKYMFNVMNSALIRMDVDYGGSGIPSFFRENGAPVDIRLALTFKELQVLTKEMILKDY